MAQIVGYPGGYAQGNTANVDTVQQSPLGTRGFDKDGNEYIYLRGVASTVAGSIATFNTSFQTALSVTGVRGPVAVACAAILANQFGWYQIFGSGTADYAGAAVAGAKVYSAGTGKCDDAVVAGDQIDGAFVGATVGGAGSGSILLCYPRMNGLG